MADLKYSVAEWIAEEDGLCVIGILTMLKDSLGDYRIHQPP